MIRGCETHAVSYAKVAITISLCIASALSTLTDFSFDVSKRSGDSNSELPLLHGNCAMIRLVSFGSVLRFHLLIHFEHFRHDNSGIEITKNTACRIRAAANRFVTTYREHHDGWVSWKNDARATFYSELLSARETLFGDVFGDSLRVIHILDRWEMRVTRLKRRNTVTTKSTNVRLCSTLPTNHFTRRSRRFNDTWLRRTRETYFQHFWRWFERGPLFWRAEIARDMKRPFDAMYYHVAIHLATDYWTTVAILEVSKCAQLHSVCPMTVSREIRNDRLMLRTATSRSV